MFFTVTCKSKKGDMIEKSYYRVVPGKKTIFIVGIFQRLPLITDAEIKEWKVKFDKLKIVTIAPSSSPTPQTPLPTPEAQKPASPQ